MAQGVTCLITKAIANENMVENNSLSPRTGQEDPQCTLHLYLKVITPMLNYSLLGCDYIMLACPIYSLHSHW